MNLPEEKLEWSALEYKEKDRSVDWFWALAVIIITSSAAAIIFGNYFFAILLILSGILLGYFAVKKPDMILYELNEKGLQIRNRIFLYEDIHGFWVQKRIPEFYSELPGHKGLPSTGPLEPALFVETKRLLFPIFSIPIDENLADKIRRRMLSRNVPEKHMKEHPAENIMDRLGF